MDLAHSGKELFGTVVRTGRMKKTVTVLVSRYTYHKTYLHWMSRSKKFHVHDEDEYCKIGDKVVIRSCNKISNTKAYYVRNVVLPVGRHNFYEGQMSKDERECIEYNERLREKQSRAFV